jgi:superfamily II DNA/RNA helicase
VSTTTSDIASPMSASLPSFADLGVPAPIVRALSDAGVEHPFPIQTATLPDSLAGRDVLGRGRTGSGKTIAFAIPTVTALAATAGRRRPSRPRALILVPTRELANQVTEVIRPLAKAMGLRHSAIYGGVGQSPQVNTLKAGVDIVVACPGRLEDLIQQGHCRLDDVEVTVLDEADHMADLGFLPAVRRLMDATPRDGQRLLFSATLDNGIDVLVKRFLDRPVVHSVDPEVAPVSTMTHHIFAVTSADKATVVRELAAGRDRSLLFMRTKHGAKKLAQQLTKSGIPAVELHGNLSQGARERNLAAFADGSSKVLVATDIAARGIHVDDVALVIHVDPPAEHKAYLHRSGRTARAGAEGIVVTMMTPDQVTDVKALTKAASIQPTVTRVAPGHEAITGLVGEPADYVTPVVVAARPQPSPQQQNPRRGGAPTGRPAASRHTGRARAASDTSSFGRPANRPASVRADGSAATRPATPSGGRSGAASNRPNGNSSARPGGPSRPGGTSRRSGFSR